MKKVISIFLSVLTVVFAFTGCSSNSNKINEQKTEQAVQVNYTLSYTFDSHYSQISQSSVRAYETLCSAVVNYESQASFNTALIDDVNKLFYSSFPLAVLVDKIELNSDKSGVAIKYKNDKNTHFQLVNEFNDKINQILGDCGKGTVSNDVFLLNLYSYVGQNIKVSSGYNSIFDAVVNGIGFASSYANTLSFLLLQSGFKSAVVNSTNENGIAFMVETDFNGKTYYFNPYNEVVSTSGKGLTSFALTLNELNGLGYGEVSYSDGISVTSTNNDSSFPALRNTSSYSVENNVLLATQNNGEIVQIALK